MSNVHRVLRLDTCCVTRALIQEMPAMNDPIKDDSEYEVFSNGGGGVPAAGAGLVTAEEDSSNSSDADSDVSDQEGVPAISCNWVDLVVGIGLKSAFVGIGLTPNPL